MNKRGLVIPFAARPFWTRYSRGNGAKFDITDRDF
jgi:hypothetical protein